MSKLKVVKQSDILWGNWFTEYYLKSEADKVIAELKAREDVLVTDNRNLLDKVKVLEDCLRENAEHFKRNEAQILENADKVIAHQKIKRCEAMADYCSYKAWYYKYNGKEEKFYRWMKFRRIWVKLYNHFKEAK